MTPLQIAQLLQILLPIGAGIYNQIRGTAAGASLPPVETLLSQADANYDAVIAAAQAELAKLPPAK